VDGLWTAFAVTSGLCGLLMAFAGFLIRGVARRAAAGELEVNRVAGIRTRATTASDEAWSAGHQAAAADSARAGSVAISVAIASVVVPVALGLAGVVDAATAMVVSTLLLMIGVVVLVTFLFRAVRAANAAARAVVDDGR